MQSKTCLTYHNGMQLLWDHCFPFGYSTFLWVSSPCGVVHWNSITAQTSASNQHHFPTCPPPVFFALGRWTFFFHPLQSSANLPRKVSIPSWKSQQDTKRKAFPKSNAGMVASLQISRGRQSRVFLKGQAEGRCVRNSCKSPTHPLKSHSFLAYRPELPPLLPLGSNAHSQELLRLFFHTLTQKKWSPAANTGFFF